MIKEPVIEAYKISLRPLQHDDLECVRLWRNDPAIAQWMIDRDHISAEQQKKWFDSVSQDQSQWHFVAWFRDQRIGVLNIKTLDNKSILDSECAEPGLYIGEPKYRGNFIAFCPALALNDYCFNELGMKSLQARVFNNNEGALKFNTALGYNVIDKGETMTNMSLKPEKYFVESLKIKRLIR